MAKLSIAEADVLAASKHSWDELFRGRKNWEYDLMAIARPEVVEAHTKMTRAILEHKCDLSKAIPNLTGFPWPYGDTKSMEHHKRFAQILKDWAYKRGLG